MPTVHFTRSHALSSLWQNTESTVDMFVNNSLLVLKLQNEIEDLSHNLLYNWDNSILHCAMFEKIAWVSVL